MEVRAAERPLLDTRAAAFLVFSAGFAIAVFVGLTAGNADVARAKATIWPCAALGGWAVALMICHGFGPARDAARWRVWWAWGLLAYAVHLWWGFGKIFDGSVAAVYASQGTVVATANFALLFLWGASVIAAFAGWPAKWLHIVTALLFAIAMLSASLLFGRDFSPVGGAVLAVLWLGALYLRQPKPE